MYVGVVLGGKSLYVHTCTIHGFFENRKYFDLLDNGGLPPLGDSYIQSRLVALKVLPNDL